MTTQTLSSIRVPRSLIHPDPILYGFSSQRTHDQIFLVKNSARVLVNVSRYEVTNFDSGMHFMLLESTDIFAQATGLRHDLRNLRRRLRRKVEEVAFDIAARLLQLVPRTLSEFNVALVPCAHDHAWVNSKRIHFVKNSGRQNSTYVDCNSAFTRANRLALPIRDERENQRHHCCKHSSYSTPRVPVNDTLFAEPPALAYPVKRRHTAPLSVFERILP